jgi:hypothetical protein
VLYLKRRKKKKSFLNILTVDDNGREIGEGRGGEGRGRGG